MPSTSVRRHHRYFNLERLARVYQPVSPTARVQRRPVLQSDGTLAVAWPAPDPPKPPARRAGPSSELTAEAELSAALAIGKVAAEVLSLLPPLEVAAAAAPRHRRRRRRPASAKAAKPSSPPLELARRPLSATPTGRAPILAPWALSTPAASPTRTTLVRPLSPVQKKTEGALLGQLACGARVAARLGTPMRKRRGGRRTSRVHLLGI